MTDAKGRKFEVIKVPCPPPMFRTHREADSIDVSWLTACRASGCCCSSVLPQRLRKCAAGDSSLTRMSVLPLCAHLQPEHITKGYVPRLANARLPGSYINHYCANGGVVVPQFGYPTDQQAIDALQSAYGPGYKVVGVPGGTREVLLNAGNVHCITQQHVLGGY
jgi:agmatine deiminase